MPTHVSDDLKLRAVQHYLVSSNYAATTITLMVLQTSLKRWVDRYNEHRNVSRKITVGVRPANVCEKFIVESSILNI